MFLILQACRLLRATPAFSLNVKSVVPVTKPKALSDWGDGCSLVANNKSLFFLHICIQKN